MIKEKIFAGRTAHELSFEGNKALVLTGFGGTVQSLEIDGLERLRGDEETEFLENPKFRGRLLFPFNDRIPDAQYKFAGKTQKLSINCEEDGSAIHGLIYDKEMKLVSQTENSLELSVVVSKEQGYPFSLSLNVLYTLSSAGIHLSFGVKNIGNEVAPFALGWHPYLKHTGSCNDWRVQLEGKTYVDVDEGLLPTGRTPFVAGTEFDFRSSTSIGEKELDLAISKSEDGLTVLSHGVSKLVLKQSEEFPYVQFYIPEERDSIAIEPITAATDSFNRPALGRIDLEPGGIWSADCSIEKV